MSGTYLRCCEKKIEGLWLHCPICGKYLARGIDYMKQEPDITPNNSQYVLFGAVVTPKDEEQ